MPRRTIGFFAEMRAGWDFLRHETVLLANTLQATVGQFTLGILIALTVIYASEVFGSEPIGPTAVWGFLETAIGLGNLVGGFIIGLIGARLAKGRMVIVGYAGGACASSFRDHRPPLAGARVIVRAGHHEHDLRHPEPDAVPAAHAGRTHGSGRRLPVLAGVRLDDDRHGRRRVMAQVLPVTTVIAPFGLITVVAGLAGLLVPAVRNA